MLKNVTKGKKIDSKVLFLKGVMAKSLGAISQNPSYTLLIETRFGIHTFLVSRPIDIAIVDKKGKVVKIKERLKPNRLFFWNPKYSFVLEIPAGGVKNLSLEIGNILRFSL